jgi:hypothetical protein
MTDADSVIAGQLHQSFVCTANTVHKKRYAQRMRERERERKRESAGFRRPCCESGWECFWESAGSRGLLLGWGFGDEYYISGIIVIYLTRDGQIKET